MALAHAKVLVNSKSYSGSNIKTYAGFQHTTKPSQKRVYFSRKDGELLIVINLGASFSVNPNIYDFVGRSSQIEASRPIQTSMLDQKHGIVLRIGHKHETVLASGIFHETQEWILQDGLQRDLIYYPQIWHHN
jgi:hypothetical protein